ncbi:hypothetical protein ATANTOWER_016887 [Ataeniobius toweri]|uniref:Uncharacterized protein n=1 Tax=Ataeniobius toweri TaxID=208326 RepID=A0ABU7AG31_9TELE|nr:hypothetical protein [Ataeniobius toweri]
MVTRTEDSSRIGFSTIRDVYTGLPRDPEEKHNNPQKQKSSTTPVLTPLTRSSEAAAFFPSKSVFSVNKE